MRTTTLGILGLILLIMTVLFLLLFIGSIASAGPLQTFEQVLAYASHPGALAQLFTCRAGIRAHLRKKL